MARCLDYLLLTILGLAFFAPLIANPDAVLYSDHSDFLAMHVPAKRCLVRHYRVDGEIPLWCPERYSGAPFVHDIQLAAYYPLHLPLLVMSDAAIGPAMSFLVVLHVLIAAWGSYTYARFASLGRCTALVVGIGTMFAGRWLLTVLLGGHYIALGVAWLPWVIWSFEKALVRHGLYWSTWTALFTSLILLSTHPQWTLYAGLVVLAWTFPASKTLHDWLRWLALGCWAIVLALALASIQLLPTLEAVPLSTRAAGVDRSAILGQALLTIQAIVGPALTGIHANLAWEERGGLGLAWLALALMAPLLRPSVQVRKHTMVTLLLIAFALGGSMLVQGLPIFSWFRQPARMFVVLGFPIAYLAGVSVDALVAVPLDAPQRRLARVAFALVVFGCALLVGGFAWQLHREGYALVRHGYWLSILVTVPMLFVALGKPLARRELLFPVLLLIDSWALVWPAVQTRPQSEVYPSLAIVEYLQGREGRILAVDQEGTTVNPLGTGTPLAQLHGMESVRGYAPLDVRRYKEFLQFLGDEDAPLQSLQHPFTYPILGDVPIKVASLANLLGIRYVVQPASAPLPPGSWDVVAEDLCPRAYDCVRGGMRDMEPYIILENRDVYPRAWIVPRTKAMPTDVLTALKQTDFRQVALTARDHSVPSGKSAAARVLRRSANRIELDVADAGPGILVLSELDFPGWTCAIDGVATPIVVANHALRAVELPAGARRAVFEFAPRSLARGKLISEAALLVAALTLLFTRPRLRSENS